ncbi:hypothetical protein SAMN05444172_9212 [Burkholderia sp. GAS332]|nr:hypothetical protein SAMN05444172_9212 [Burkholderia sp. GAS332]
MIIIASVLVVRSIEMPWPLGAQITGSKAFAGPGPHCERV